MFLFLFCLFYFLFVCTWVCFVKGDGFKCKGLLSVMAFVVPYRVTQPTEARKLTHLIYLALLFLPPRDFAIVVRIFGWNFQISRCTVSLAGKPSNEPTCRERLTLSLLRLLVWSVTLSPFSIQLAFLKSLLRVEWRVVCQPSIITQLKGVSF